MAGKIMSRIRKISKTAGRLFSGEIKEKKRMSKLVDERLKSVTNKSPAFFKEMFGDKTGDFKEYYNGFIKSVNLSDLSRRASAQKQLEKVDETLRTLADNYLRRTPLFNEIRDHLFYKKELVSKRMPLEQRKDISRKDIELVQMINGFIGFIKSKP